LQTAAIAASNDSFAATSTPCYPFARKMSIEYNAVLRPIVLGAKFRVVMSPITVHLWGPQHQFIQYYDILTGSEGGG
jgi:hypothetical protein